ncbi:hypothetical protein MMC11_002807 [Xylographa trunciseda]|nr:hypothetical protein [Xylographa trunciseda]
MPDAICYGIANPSRAPDQQEHFSILTSNVLYWKIRYFRSQMDKHTGTFTRASRQSPLRLLVRDAGVLVRMLPYLPLLVIPFRTSNKQAELYMNMGGLLDIVLQSWLFFVEIVLLFLAPIAMAILPGGVFFLTSSLACVLVYVASYPMQGSRIVYSKTNNATIAFPVEHKHERWLFINGCITGHRGLQLNVNQLAKTFGRPVTGIHNQTYGLVADLLECLVQRCFAINTMDVRVAYDYTKACLLDSTVDKVILIVHSQGGIIASLVLDSLYADLPCAIMSKLEVYTFGSAASHFNDPHLVQPPATPKYCVPHIEHYINELDLVPRWGVLYNVCQVLDNRYCGNVFVRIGATGPLFNQHYMDPMFPLDAAFLGGFLDQIVDVDDGLRICGGTETAGQVEKSRRKSAEPKNGTSKNLERTGVETENSVIMDGGTPSGAVLINFAEPNAAQDARGKTVRQISRLCKYLDGGSPSNVF